MKKSILVIMLLSSATLSANTKNCIESIRLAKAANIQVIGEIEGTAQPVRQQQQSHVDNHVEPSFGEKVRLVYVAVREGLKSASALSNAKANVKYYNILEKIESGNFTSSEARALVGSDQQSNIVNFKQRGDSVCLSSVELDERIANINSEIQKLKSFTERSKSRPGYIRTYTYEMNFLDHFNNSVEIPREIMGMNGEHFLDLENTEVNALKVRTKSQLRRAIQR